MTQTELAAKIDLTNTAVCRHEAGNRKIGPETERLYNKALGAVSIRKKP